MDAQEFHRLVEQIEAGALQEGRGHGAASGATAEGGELPSHIVSTFHHFDKNRSGHLDYRELRNALRFYGIDVTHPRAAGQLTCLAPAPCLSALPLVRHVIPLAPARRLTATAVSSARRVCQDV